jgi:citrate lyase gamma subunit
MPFSEEFIEKWEHIIRDVDVTEVPLECLKKVVIRLEGRKQKTINVQLLKRRGHQFNQIETLINNTLNELDLVITDVEFIVDVEMVAEIVQPATDKLLKGA